MGGDIQSVLERSGKIIAMAEIGSGCLPVVNMREGPITPKRGNLHLRRINLADDNQK